MSRRGSWKITALWLVCAIRATSATAASEASPPISSRVDALFAPYDKPSSPGCALAVIQDGSITYERGYGMASLESGKPISPQTIFDIGSTAKQFAATSILLLARDGKLSLDDDIHKYVPVLADYGAKVTLRNLLHHTSGLPDYIDLLRLTGARTGDVVTDEQALHLLALAQRLEFPPGSKHVYCNSGFFLLSLVVRQASGQTLRDFARERIFAPLGMTRTQYVNDHTFVVPGRATGYAERKGGGYRLQTSNWEQNGDGGLLTTVEDLARWDQNFYDTRVGGRELIDLLQMPGVLTTGEKLTYAMGLRVDSYRGLKRVRHGGGWAGFRAELLRFPEQRFSVVTLCNLGNVSAGRLAAQVADLYLEKDFRSPSEPSRTLTAGREGVREGKPSQSLTRFSGLYWDPVTDDTVHIAEKESRLHWIGDDGNDDELTLIGDDRFQTQDGLEVSFRSSGSGRAEMLAGAAGEPPRAYRPMDSWLPAGSKLSAYTGPFWCPELETRYLFKIVGEQLVLQGRNGQSEVVKPVFRDTFDSDLAGLIHFHKTASQVSTFEVLSGATRLTFVRQPRAGG